MDARRYELDVVACEDEEFGDIQFVWVREGSIRYDYFADFRFCHENCAVLCGS